MNGKRREIPVTPLACVAWRFWLGELSDKGRRGPLVLARFARESFVDTPPLRPARQNRHATQAITPPERELQ